MSISAEDRQKTIEKFGGDSRNTGASQTQIALLSLRINDLQHHFKAHPKDRHSRRGLIAMVNRRRKLLDYLKRRDEAAYLKLIKELKIRR